VALTQPSVRIASFSDDVRFSPAVESMLGRITLVENPATPTDKRETWSTVLCGCAIAGRSATAA
jgi:hypothetical protein